MSLNKRQIRDRVNFAFAVLNFLQQRLRLEEIFPKVGIANKQQKFNQNKLKKFLRESNSNLRDFIYNLGTDRGPADIQRVAEIIQNDPIIEAVFQKREASTEESSDPEQPITTPASAPLPSEPAPLPSDPAPVSSSSLGSPNFYRANDIARRLTGKELGPAPAGQNLRTQLFNHLKKYGYPATMSTSLINQNINRLIAEGVPADELQEFQPPAPPTKAQGKKPKKEKTVAQQEAIINQQQDQDLGLDISELPAIESATQQTTPAQDPIPAVERVQPRAQPQRIPIISPPRVPAVTSPEQIRVRAQETWQPSGDVQQDIIQEAQEGKQTAQPRPLQSSEVSGVQGLNIRADQLRRITANIRDPNIRAAATEILGRNTIDFNLLFDRLGTASALGVIAQMIGGPLASAFSPIVGASIPQIRTILGADFNKFFRTQGNQLQIKTRALRELQDRSLDEILNSGNIDQLSQIRNQLQALTEQQRINPEQIRRFDRVSNRRYVLNTSSLLSDEDTEQRRNLNRFLDAEANIVARLEDVINRDNFRDLRAIIDAYDTAFNTAPLTVTQEYSRAIQRAYEIPYFQAVRFVVNNEQMEQDFIRTSYNDILSRTIRSNLPIDQQEVIIRSYANAMNDMQSLFLPDTRPIVPPTDEQIEAERARLRTISNTETVSRGIAGSAVAGGLVAGGIAAARGTGLQASLQAGVTGAVTGAGVGAGVGTLGALSGAASAIPAIVAGVAAGVQQGLTTKPIMPPPDTLKIIQQEQQSKKGTLRPKFIVPSTSILEKSQSEIQADFDEFAMFDFVIPSSEGTEGNNKNNPLKRSDYLSHQLRLNGGGIEVDVPLGELDLPTKTTINEVMVGPELPEMTFENSVYNLSEFEVTPYDPNDDRLQIEALNPYKYYSRVEPFDISRSVLYSKVP